MLGARLVEMESLLEYGLRVAIESRIGLDGKPAVPALFASKMGFSSFAALAGHFFHQPPRDLVLGGRGNSSIRAAMRSFQTCNSCFRTSSTMTGLQVAPTAPFSIESVSSEIAAESFHRLVGVVWVISCRGLL